MKPKSTGRIMASITSCSRTRKIKSTTQTVFITIFFTSTFFLLLDNYLDKEYTSHNMLKHVKYAMQDPSLKIEERRRSTQVQASPVKDPLLDVQHLVPDPSLKIEQKHRSNFLQTMKKNAAILNDAKQQNKNDNENALGIDNQNQSVKTVKTDESVSGKDGGDETRMEQNIPADNNKDEAMPGGNQENQNKDNQEGNEIPDEKENDVAVESIYQNIPPKNNEDEGIPNDNNAQGVDDMYADDTQNARDNDVGADNANENIPAENNGDAGNIPGKNNNLNENEKENSDTVAKTIQENIPADDENAANVPGRNNVIDTNSDTKSNQVVDKPGEEIKETVNEVVRESPETVQANHMKTLVKDRLFQKDKYFGKFSGRLNSKITDVQNAQSQQDQIQSAKGMPKLNENKAETKIGVGMRRAAQNQNVFQKTIPVMDKDQVKSRITQLREAGQSQVVNKAPNPNDNIQMEKTKSRIWQARQSNKESDGHNMPSKSLRPNDNLQVKSRIAQIRETGQSQVVNKAPKPIDNLQMEKPKSRIWQARQSNKESDIQGNLRLLPKPGEVPNPDQIHALQKLENHKNLRNLPKPEAVQKNVPQPIIPDKQVQDHGDREKWKKSRSKSLRNHIFRKPQILHKPGTTNVSSTSSKLVVNREEKPNIEVKDTHNEQNNKTNVKSEIKINTGVKDKHNDENAKTGSKDAGNEQVQNTDVKAGNGTAYYYYQYYNNDDGNAKADTT